LALSLPVVVIRENTGLFSGHIHKGAHATLQGSGTSEEVSTEAEKKPQAPTLPFRVFLKYLVPDILLLLAAVLTAFGSAYLNIRIPAALGGLINVFNDMSKSGGTSPTRED
jgi:hypothetical protein